MLNKLSKTQASKEEAARTLAPSVNSSLVLTFLYSPLMPLSFGDRLSQNWPQTVSVAKSALGLLSPLLPLPKGWDYRQAALHCFIQCWELNPWPRALQASTLPTEPRPGTPLRSFSQIFIVAVNRDHNDLLCGPISPLSSCNPEKRRPCPLLHN